MPNRHNNHKSKSNSLSIHRNFWKIIMDKLQRKMLQCIMFSNQYLVVWFVSPDALRLLFQFSVRIRLPFQFPVRTSPPSIPLNFGFNLVWSALTDTDHARVGFELNSSTKPNSIRFRSSYRSKPNPKHDLNSLA